MVDLRHDYNDIADGVALTAGNTGHSSVNFTNGSTGVASTTTPIEGAASALLTPTSGGACQLIDTVPASPGIAGAFAFTPDGPFSVASNILQHRNGTGRTAYIHMRSSDGKLQVLNAADSVLIVTPSAYTSGDRIELLAVKGTTTADGRIVFAVYSGDTETLSAGLTEVYDTNDIGGTNTGTADMTSARYARSNGTTDTTPQRLDRVWTRSDTTALIGRWSIPATVNAPVAAATALALAPTVIAAATVSAVVGAGTAAAPTPTVSAAATVQAVTATATADALVPVVTGGGSGAATVNAPTATATANAPGPVITGAARIAPPVATAVGVAYSPGVSAGALLTAVVATTTAHATAPTIHGAARILSPVTEVTAEAYAPQMSAGVLITAPVATAIGMAWPPIINGIARDITVTGAIGERRWTGSGTPRTRTSVIGTRRWEGTL